VVFTAGAQIGEGRILDVTIPGCLIESPVTVQEDQSVQLKIHLPGLKRPLTVGLGVVRWTVSQWNGSKGSLQGRHIRISQILELC
jgi:hypothetical protein